MARIFIISDTHFGHHNILNFTATDGSKIRTFQDTAHMDEHMVECWNDTVNNDDIIYHLGDVYFGQGHEVLPRLKGRKRLILGNHDNGKDQNLLKHFQKISLWRMFPEYGVLLTHVPAHPSAFEYKNMKNIHGHIHQNTTMTLNEDGTQVPDLRYINVSVEKIDYTPVSLESLVGLPCGPTLSKTRPYSPKISTT